MRDRRSTDKRAKRRGIKIEKIWARTELCGTPQVRGNEGELCGGIPTVDVRDERYEEKLTIVVKQRKCQTRWKDDGVVESIKCS